MLLYLVKPIRMHKLVRWQQYRLQCGQPVHVYWGVRLSVRYLNSKFTVKFNDTLIVLLNLHLADSKYTPAPLLDTPFEHTLASIGYARKDHFAQGPDQSQQGSKIEA